MNRFHPAMPAETDALARADTLMAIIDRMRPGEFLVWDHSKGGICSRVAADLSDESLCVKEGLKSGPFPAALIVTIELIVIARRLTELKSGQLWGAGPPELWR